MEDKPTFAATVATSNEEEAKDKVRTKLRGRSIASGFPDREDDFTILWVEEVGEETYQVTFSLRSEEYVCELEYIEFEACERVSVEPSED